MIPQGEQKTYAGYQKGKWGGLVVKKAFAGLAGKAFFSSCKLLLRFSGFGYDLIAK